MFNRLKQVRQHLRLTQEQMGEKCGIKKSAYSMIENGKVKLTVRNKQQLISSLNINEVWLNTGEGKMFASDEYNIHPSQEEHSTHPNADIKTIERKYNFKLMPIYNIDSLGKKLSGISPINYYPFPEAAEGDIAVTTSSFLVSSSSAIGAAILIREITNWRTFIEYNKTYVIVLTDGRKLLKKLLQNPDIEKNGDEMYCMSLSDDNNVTLLPTEIIDKLYIVKYSYHVTSL